MNTRLTARITRLSFTRGLHHSTRRPTAWSPQPSPPKLPKEEQEIFEQLQKQSAGAFSTPRQPPRINQSPHSQQDSPEAVRTAESPSQSAEALDQTSSIKANVKKGDELHPNVRRGAKPEFEGDTNPQTGEVGGPKNNPIRWSQMEGDWSFNGRVSDF